MKEAAITQSPFVYIPGMNMSEKEKEELYRTRIDESYRPYTVIDVLTKVYRRNFKNDLLLYVGEHLKEFVMPEDGWSVSRIWVNDLQTIRSESVFFQPVERFEIDILVEGRMKFEFIRRFPSDIKNSGSRKVQLRLRYRLDLRPCALTCHFVKVILTEEESLQYQDAYSLPVDKYLLPVMGADDYQHMANWIRLHYFTEYFGLDVAVDPQIWVERLGHTVKYASFPEEGVLGEFFFGFGSADIVNENSGERRRDNVDPGSILLNIQVKESPSLRKSTLAHEGTHAYLGKYFFLLQKTHGHEYCSYMCKRNSDNAKSDYKSPLERMEIQANTLPRYLMIPEMAGKARAMKLLASYGGKRSLANMQRLVDDMASYYGTTKIMARSRLMDFGYNEVRGILRSANGNLIPAYYSTLQKEEVYAISEKDAIEEYMRNPAFRRIVNSGYYLYVPENGCFCRNEPKYIFFDDALRPHLKRYARENMTECCLVFRETSENTVIRLINGIIQKTSYGGRGRKKIQYVGFNGESPITEEGKQLRRQIERQMAEKATLEMSFNDMTVHLMQIRKVSVGKLAELTGLSDETIKNLRNKSGIAFPIREVVAVCIALKLSPIVSESYINKSPTKFVDSVEMRLYEYAMKQWYLEPLPVVNRKLVEAGVQPLTNLVDGYDENGIKIAT